jgi:hypothetical protein
MHNIQHRQPRPPTNETLSIIQSAREPGGRARRGTISLDAQSRFLAVFARTGVVAIVCRAAAISSAQIDHWLETDVAFQERYHEAREEATDWIIHEVWQRAVEGWDEPLRYRGHPATDAHGDPVLLRRYSDRLLLALCRWRLPEWQQGGRDAGRVRTHQLPRGQRIVSSTGKGGVERVNEAHVLLVPARRGEAD